MVKTKLSKERIKYIWFYLFLSLYLLATYLTASMLTYQIPYALRTGLLILSASFLLLKVLIFDSFRYRDIILIIIALALTFFIAYKIKNIRFFTDSIVIVSCIGIDFKKIIKTYFIVSISFMVAITISSQVGIVTDLVYSNSTRGLRHSLGLLYPTVYSARIFFLGLAYLYLRAGKLKIYEVVSLLGIAYLLIVFTDGRLDSYLLIASILVFYLYPKLNIHFVKFISLIGCVAPLIGAALSYFSASIYDSMNPFHVTLNRLFSTRLSLGNLALSLYQSKPFGQVIFEQGNGGLAGYNNLVNQYFFIDSSYLSILLKNGWIFFAGLLFLMVYRLAILYKEKKYYLILAWSLVCINSMVATFLFSLEVNVFIIFLFSNLKNEKIFVNQSRNGKEQIMQSSILKLKSTKLSKDVDI